jgi:hypothetical protein
MKIASQHPKGQRSCTGQDVIERFLFDGVTLQSRHVPKGHAQFSSLVEAHLADAAFARADQAAVSARKAAHRAIGFRRVQIAFHR